MLLMELSPSLLWISRYTLAWILSARASQIFVLGKPLGHGVRVFARLVVTGALMQLELLRFIATGEAWVRLARRVRRAKFLASSKT